MKCPNCDNILIFNDEKNAVNCENCEYTEVREKW